MTLTILHGSDLHFGKPYDERAGEAFQAAARILGPDVIVVSGDLTQRAKAREFERAREYLDRLPPGPLVVTPGNHDVPLYRVLERLFTPYRNYRRWISEELESVTRVEGGTLVSVNTAAPRRAIVNGRVRPRQMDFARRAFADAPPGDARIVVAHHHLAPAPDYEVDRPMPGAKDILEAFEGMRVELVLGGHLHRAFIGNSLDIHPGADRRHGIVIVQSGTTTSRRGRAREQAKNSFNVVRISPEHLEITHYMYFEEEGAFAPFSMHAFPRRDRMYFTSDPFGTGEWPVLADAEEAR